MQFAFMRRVSNYWLPSILTIIHIIEQNIIKSSMADKILLENSNKIIFFQFSF